MNLHFNLKDLFRAPRIAFRFQKIWINGIGLFFGYLIYLVFTYLSLVIDGNNFSAVWAKYGILVCSYSQVQNWYSQIIFLFGLSAFFAIFLLTNTAVSRAVYMELRKEFFYSWRQAFKFTFRKWISVLGAIFTFLFMIIFFVIGAIVIGLIGRIPIIGELGNFLLIIPYMLASLLLIFILIVTFFGIFLVPPIIATSDEDSLGGVFQSFSITFNQPWRLIIYSAITSLLEVLGIVILAFAIKKAYLVLEVLLGIGMGDKFANISGCGLFLFDKALPQLFGWIQCVFGSFTAQIYLGYHHIPVTLSFTENIAAYIFVTCMLILSGSVISFGEAIRNGGFTILYISLYNFHENENLLEREVEELNRELEKEEKESPKEETD
jgi:hypothetical protein